ncbi:hypothetical protein AWB82_03278 [Caballeronia glebae]|uniref:Uncharacterized protein n=1 Tax=Caballeronia glebae TaxID=1777143 RepID=A0A158AYZ5_9BURK|nr:hypothetical protein AWB82_03278 [Caballeronia glebae]
MDVVRERHWARRSVWIVYGMKLRKRKNERLLNSGMQLTNA